MMNWSAGELFWAAQSQDRLTSEAARGILLKRYKKGNDFRKDLGLPPDLKPPKKQTLDQLIDKISGEIAGHVTQH